MLTQEIVFWERGVRRFQNPAVDIGLRSVLLRNLKNVRTQLSMFLCITAHLSNRFITMNINNFITVFQNILYSQNTVVREVAVMRCITLPAFSRRSKFRIPSHLRIFDALNVSFKVALGGKWSAQIEIRSNSIFLVFAKTICARNRASSIKLRRTLITLRRVFP